MNLGTKETKFVSGTHYLRLDKTKAKNAIASGSRSSSSSIPPPTTSTSKTKSTEQETSDQDRRKDWMRWREKKARISQGLGPLNVVEVSSLVIALFLLRNLTDCLDAIDRL